MQVCDVTTNTGHIQGAPHTPWAFHTASNRHLLHWRCHRYHQDTPRWCNTHHRCVQLTKVCLAKYLHLRQKRLFEHCYVVFLNQFLRTFALFLKKNYVTTLKQSPLSFHNIVMSLYNIISICLTIFSFLDVWGTVMFLPRAHCWNVVWWVGHEHTQPLTSSTMTMYLL